MELIYKISNKLSRILDILHVQYLKFVCGHQIGNNCRISRKSSFKGLYGKVKIGDNCIIEPNVRIKFVQNTIPQDHIIEIESNVFIGYSTIIDAGCSIKVGKNTMIGPNVFITDANHILKTPNIPIALQGGIFNPTSIGENSWIGAHSQILSGASIGNNSIVAANTTVIQEFPDNFLITGTPAKIKKKLFEQNH